MGVQSDENENTGTDEQNVEEDANTDADSGEQDGSDEAPENEGAGDEDAENEGSDELPDSVKEVLKKKNDENKSLRTRLRDLEAKMEGLKTPEEFEAFRAEFAAESAAEARTLLVENIALQTGLPEALRGRLVGETREELEADAKALLESLGSLSSDEDSLEGGLSPRDRDPDAGMSPRELARKLSGR